MNQSESIVNLAGALVEAHAEVQNATKDSTNPHFRSGYASLNSLVDTVKPVFLRHGIAIVQFPAAGHDGAALETMILHKSGEFLSTIATTPIAKQDPQGIGSAYTYLRRYALAAVAQIAQADDDGNAASYSPDHASARTAGSGLNRSLHCPQVDCGEFLWDNRAEKAADPSKAKRPDLKCSNKDCGLAIWLESWSIELIQQADAALKAGALDEKGRDYIHNAVMDENTKIMLKSQKRLNEMVS